MSETREFPLPLVLSIVDGTWRQWETDADALMDFVLGVDHHWEALSYQDERLAQAATTAVIREAVPLEKARALDALAKAAMPAVGIPMIMLRQEDPADVYPEPAERQPEPHDRIEAVAAAHTGQHRTFSTGSGRAIRLECSCGWIVDFRYQAAIDNLLEEWARHRTEAQDEYDRGHPDDVGLNRYTSRRPIVGANGGTSSPSRATTAPGPAERWMTGDDEHA